MKRGRSTLIFLGVAVALGAYIWFVESKRETSDAEPKAERVFASLETDAVTKLTVTATNGDVTTLEKSGSTWAMTAPLRVGVDASEVAGVTSNLTTLDITRVVDEQPASLEPFGLEEPRIKVAFTANGQERTLLLGARTPAGGDVYAKLEEAPRVFIVPGWLESGFDKTTFQLRDKSIVKVDREAIDRISIIGTPGTLELVKDGETWRLAQPIAARADTNEIGSLLTRLTSGQMQAVVAEEPATLDTYGLRPARTTVAVSGQSKVLAEVLIGTASGESAVHAKDASRQVVFTIDKALADDLQRGVETYRAKDVFTFRTFNVTRLVIVRGDTTRTFERVKTGEGDAAVHTWKQTAPEDAGVTSGTIDDIASRLSTLRVDGWASAPAGAMPVMSVVATIDNGTEERVSIVKAGERYLAVRDGEPGAAVLLAPAVTDVIELLERKPEPTPTPAPGDAQ